MTDPMQEDIELELRGRLTTLEQRLPALEETLGLVALGALAAVVAAVTLTLMLRKRLAS